MRRITTGSTVALLAAVGLAIVTAACGEKTGAGTSGAPEAKATVAAAPSAAPPASAQVEHVVAAASSSAEPGAKTFDCGAKGQKPCPMQGWMKTVMAGAASGGDGDKLAQALTYVALHVPPGYTEWAAMSRDGAKKAKAGDIEGAKTSCKLCHDAYKDKYKATMRDRPF